jgi:hypothetical protein
MIEVKINMDGYEAIYNFPESWDEVTVKQFAELYKTKNPNNNDLLGAVNIISALAGIEQAVLLQMDIDDFKELSNKLTFITKEIPKTEVDYLELDGDKYYLYTEFNKYTTGEVITIETLMEGAQNDVNKIMADLLCLFLRKKDEDGKFEKFTTDMLRRKELFLGVPISNIYHIFLFFSTGRNTSTNNMKDSTRSKDQSTTLKEDLQKS